MSNVKYACDNCFHVGVKTKEWVKCRKCKHLFCHKCKDHIRAIDNICNNCLSQNDDPDNYQENLKPKTEKATFYCLHEGNSKTYHMLNIDDEDEENQENYR